MPSDLRNAYAALVAAGEIEQDPAQLALIRHFERLEDALSEHRLARKSSSLGWLFGKRDKTRLVRGLYIYGDVGRGKTLLMDLFFQASNVKRKRRAHFHEFMADVHERIYAYRQDKSEDDPIKRTADCDR